MKDIVDRLESITCGFDMAVFYGAGDLIHMLTDGCGVDRIIPGDFDPALISAGAKGFAGDEEAWPFASQSLDLVVSLLTLHHANDLIGALSQMRASLKPDGLFIAALFGEETLRELRAALYASETAISGGVSSRIAPFASVRDLGGAMQRAGFAMPVADMDRAKVMYENPTRLFSDLRAMGETSILQRRSAPMTRHLLQQTVERLAVQNGETTFDIIYLTGWAPHTSQPKALKPGSAKHSLAQAIKKF